MGGRLALVSATTLIGAALVAVTLTIVPRGNEMPQQADERKTAFKQRIGFDALPPPVPGRGVVLDWSDLTLPGWETAGWEVEGGPVWTQPGMVGREWTIQSDSGKIQLEVMCLADEQRAREYVVHLASLTMTVDIPYDPLERPLGDLAIKSFNPVDEELIWSHGQLILRLSAPPGGLALAVASELDSMLREHESQDIAAHAPVIDAFEVTPTRVTVGDTVSVEVSAHQGPGFEEPARVEVRDPRYLLKRDAVDGGTSTWVATQPGLTAMDLMVTNPATLIFAHAREEVEVVERADRDRDEP